MVPVFESMPFPWSVTAVDGNTPGCRESPLPVAHQRCLHSEWQSPASESQPPWGSVHLLWWRFSWNAKEREGKSHLNPTNGALSELVHNGFISQCEFSVEVTRAHSETPGTITFAGAYHLKDHLGSPALMQPSLLIEGFLLFHFFFLERYTETRFVYPQGTPCGEVNWER